MSLRSVVRTSTRTLRPLSRSVATTSIRAQEDTTQAGPSTPTTPPPSGFGALRDLLSRTKSNPLLQSASASTEPEPEAFATPFAITPRSDVVRGHLPTALPPKVDPVLDLFTKMLMKHGKKSKAENTMVRILQMIRETTNQPPIPLVHRSILLTAPSIKILTMKKALKRIDTPRALNERQRAHQAISWILKASESGRRGGLPREQRIAREILRILEGESAVFKWLEDRHKAATLARSNIMSR